MLTFFLLTLAAWRVTSLLVNEDGPADVFIRLRVKLGMRYDEYNLPVATTFLAHLLSCVWCASVWIGFLAAVLSETSRDFASFIFTALAISAGVILIERVVHV